MKKIEILFATIIMAMLFVISANAKEIAPAGQCGDNVYWNYNETTGELVISGEGDMYNYDYNTSPFYSSNIKSVSIENGVTTIGNQIFAFCRSLNSVSIANTVVRIGDYAFNHCSKISYVELPENIMYIDRYAFYYCENLENINLDSNVEVIGDCALSGCSKIKNIHLGSNVTSIGLSSFACENLNRIYVDENNLVYSNDSFGVLFNKSKTTLLQYPIGNERVKYIMPDSVVAIGTNAFRDCDNLEEVVISKNITEISRNAFYHCDSLSNINIPNGITCIESGTFSSCANLSSIVLPESVSKIESSVFYDCTNLLSITMTRNVKNIDTYAFDSCDNLKDVYYDGTKDDWEKIKIASSNECLLNALIHYHEHIYNSQITIPATHLKEGVETYTCHCGDTYTKSIDKLIDHTYNAVVTNPACTTQGFTTYTCECGDTYVDDYVDANGHSFTNYISDGKATCTTDGLFIAKCDNCDATDTKPEKGTHKFSDSFAIDLDPTCTTDGQKSRHCLNCTEKTDITPIGKLGHTYNTITIDPTCTDRGHKIYTCLCGDSYTETLPALGHNFSGSACTECGYDKADSCTCNCHKTGLSALIWKILNFFYRLLRLNPTCNCGIAHY